MDSPLVSVILPTYARPHQLRGALDSALRQTYSRLEVIVVDDNAPGSTARTQTEHLMAAFSSEPRVRYLRRGANGGGSLARNTGIVVANGSLITFLDDDDTYLQDKVERQVAHLQAEQLDVSMCNMHIHVNGKPVQSTESAARGTSLADFILDGRAYTPMIMVRRELLLAVGGFHPTPRFQDHILMIKLLEHNARAGILQEPLMVHNRHNGERISLGSMSSEAFRIRHEFEQRNLACLMPVQRTHVLFRQALTNAKLARRSDGLLTSMSYLAEAGRYARSLRDTFGLAKGALRVLFYPPVYL